MKTGRAPDGIGMPAVKGSGVEKQIAEFPESHGIVLDGLAVSHAAKSSRRAELSSHSSRASMESWAALLCPRKRSSRHPRQAVSPGTIRGPNLGASPSSAVTMMRTGDPAAIPL